MKKSTINKYLYAFVGFIVLLVIWQLLSYVIGQNTFILPSPIETIKYIIYLLSKDYIYNCIGKSFSNMLKGFALSFVIAFVLGVIAGNFEKVKYSLVPIMTMIKSIPTASLVYLFLLAAGIENAPIYIVSLVSMPILYEAIRSGIESVNENLIDALRLDGTSLVNANIKVKIPLAWPYIAVGIDSSLALSFKIEIMAEVITGSGKLGLGSAIASAQRSDPTNMIPIFAYSIIAIVIMYILDIVIDLLKVKAKNKI